VKQQSFGRLWPKRRKFASYLGEIGPALRTSSTATERANEVDRHQEFQIPTLAKVSTFSPIIVLRWHGHQLDHWYQSDAELIEHDAGCCR
jgi:hypothetical protein